MSPSGNPVMMFHKLNYQIADRSETIGQPRLTSPTSAFSSQVACDFSKHAAKRYNYPSRANLEKQAENGEVAISGGLDDVRKLFRKCYPCVGCLSFADFVCNFSSFRA